MEILFYVLAITIVSSSLGVVLLRNPIYCAFCLVVTLMGVAGLFAMLEAHFLAVVQIIVYAGAIMVLFVFVLMLLNVKAEVGSRKVSVPAVTAVVVGACFIAITVPLFWEEFGGVLPLPMAVGEIPAVGSVENIGVLLYGKYLFPFEAASILIMAALVGAVMLGKRKYR